MPSFVTEMNLIEVDYAKTIFITQILKRSSNELQKARSSTISVDEKGEILIQYFVRRKGEYHVETINDLIPYINQGMDNIPLYGFYENQPWKLLLMKAWIKEKGSIEAV
jgi:hypothetical protein